MSSDIQVKICGLRHADEIIAAAGAGARYIGFNFFARSPRSVSFGEAAGLTGHVPLGVAKVALVVDADDAMLDDLLATVPTDMIQLHGREPVARVAAIKARFGLPVMKAVGVADAGDLEALTAYGKVADQLLVDAKPPTGSELPGGNGLAFDWRLIAGRRWPCPWMLAGGLTADNVAEAIRLTGARQVDVASGVETAPGKKDAGLMARFVTAALSAG